MIRRDDIRGAIDAEFIAGIVRLFAVMRTDFSELDRAAVAQAFGTGIARHKQVRELALEVIEQQFRSDL